MSLAGQAASFKNYEEFVADLQEIRDKFDMTHPEDALHQIKALIKKYEDRKDEANYGWD